MVGKLLNLKKITYCVYVCKLRCVQRGTGVCAGPVREKQREINTRERDERESGMTGFVNISFITIICKIYRSCIFKYFLAF